jgi:hypothetical protein
MWYSQRQLQGIHPTQAISEPYSYRAAESCFVTQASRPALLSIACWPVILPASGTQLPADATQRCESWPMILPASGTQLPASGIQHCVLASSTQHFALASSTLDQQ